MKLGIGSFIVSARRILTVSKKPDMPEFKAMIKVTGLGILLIGVLGFVIKLVFVLLNFK